MYRQEGRHATRVSIQSLLDTIAALCRGCKRQMPREAEHRVPVRLQKWEEMLRDGFMEMGDVMELRGPNHIVWIDRKKNIMKLSQVRHFNPGSRERLPLSCRKRLPTPKPGPPQEHYANSLFELHAIVLEVAALRRC